MNDRSEPQCDKLGGTHPQLYKLATDLNVQLEKHRERVPLMRSLCILGRWVFPSSSFYEY